MYLIYQLQGARCAGSVWYSWGTYGLRARLSRITRMWLVSELTFGRLPVFAMSAYGHSRYSRASLSRRRPFVHLAVSQEARSILSGLVCLACTMEYAPGLSGPDAHCVTRSSQYVARGCSTREGQAYTGHGSYCMPSVVLLRGRWCSFLRSSSLSDAVDRRGQCRHWLDNRR